MDLFTIYTSVWPEVRMTWEWDQGTQNLFVMVTKIANEAVIAVGTTEAK